MAIDPAMLDVGDMSPTDLGTGTKLGHHAHDHHKHTRDADGNGIDDEAGIINPWRHAAGQAWHGLLKGATSLGLFGAVFLGVKSIPFVAGLGTVGTGVVAGALAGAIWYGGQAAYQAYNDAKDHNEGFVKRVQEKVRLRERMHALGDQIPQFGVIAGAETPIIAAQTPEGETMLVAPTVVAIEPDMAPQATPRPAFLQEILETGPRESRGFTEELLADRAAAELAPQETAR